MRGSGGATFHTLHWLKHIEGLGIPVLDGSDAYGVEISKSHQLELLEQLGIPYPRSRVINDPALALQAAQGLRYPVLVKANIGGSGAGIVRYESPAAIQTAIDAGTIPMGLDGVSLVQESAPLRDGHITRVEALGGKYLHAIDVFPDVGSFDLCPADACQTTDGAELVRGACAVDAPKNGPKVSRTGCWNESRFTHAGSHYNAAETIVEPKPVRRPRPTIYAGGESEAARALISTQCDAYVMHGDPVDRIAGTTAATRCDTVRKISCCRFLSER